MDWSTANAILFADAPATPAERAEAERLAGARIRAIGQELVRRDRRHLSDLLALVRETGGPDATAAVAPPGWDLATWRAEAHLRAYGLMRAIIRIERDHDLPPDDDPDWPLALREQAEALEDGALSCARFTALHGGMPIAPGGAS